MKDIKDVTSLTFASEVLDSPVPVLVDFWAPWCGPCRMVEPSLQELSSRFEGRARIVRINGDLNPELMQRFSVRGLPTVMLFSAGQAQHTALGVRSRSEYQRMLDEALEARAAASARLRSAAAGASASSR